MAERVPRSAKAHYLECRPGQSEQVDLLCCFATKSACDEYREILEAEPPSRESSVWVRNLALLRAWAEPGSELSRAPCIWLEYDGPSSLDSRSPAASPSVGLEPDYQQRHFEPGGGCPLWAGSLARATLRLLVPAERIEGLSALLDRCLTALPATGSVGYVSVMTARSPVALKLYVILPCRSLGSYLSAIGWPGELDRVSALQAEIYSPRLETAYLDVTLTSRVEPRLGLAVSQFHRRELGPQAEAPWPAIPSGLAAHADTLRAWQGVTRTVLCGQKAWIRRWLDLKAVLLGEHIEYKAYLGFAPTLPPPFE